MNTPGHEAHQSIKILAFDTAGDEASLALWANGKMQQVSLPFGAGSHSQAACLVPVVQDLLKEESLDFQDLDVIATSTGPGSFTGIRLGLATAQGLILSTTARSFAPTTFQLFAFGAWKERAGVPYLVTLPTKRDSFYTQAFDKTGVPSGAASIQTEDEIQGFLALYPDMYRTHHLMASSAEILIHFYFHERENNRHLWRDLRPYYVHDPEFVKQKKCSL